MKIALRNLFRNGIYSVVNITGLAVSLAVAILILLWVNDELNYDRSSVIPNKKALHEICKALNFS